MAIGRVNYLTGLTFAKVKRQFLSAPPFLYKPVPSKESILVVTSNSGADQLTFRLFPPVPGIFRVHSWSLAGLRQAQALGCLDLHPTAGD